MVKTTIEEKTCFDVMNMHIKEGSELIRSRGLSDRVTWKDGESIALKDSCYISSRINLRIKRNKIISAQVG